MTTMNNNLNITRKPAYITMRNTVVNGERWNLRLDISSLSTEEVRPVIDCLVNGPLDKRFQTPKICQFILGVMDGAAEVLMHFCFDHGHYNHAYALRLISDIKEVGLCCEDCFIEEVTILHQLFVEYMAGVETATERIAENLYEFFADTTPFVFDVI